jgi:hypothetical protein
MTTMVTVEFAEAEAHATAQAVWAYLDDDFCPSIDPEALRTANNKLTAAIGHTHDHTHDYWFVGDRMVCRICHHKLAA